MINDWIRASWELHSNTQSHVIIRPHTDGIAHSVIEDTKINKITPLNHAAILGRRASLVCLTATIYFLSAVVGAHLISPQYDMLRDYISDYAVGPRGWVYGSAYWASFFGCVSLAIALWQLVPPHDLSRIGAALMAIMGMTYLIDFFYPTDILLPGAPPVTLTGNVHFVAPVIGWLLFPFSAILITRRLRRHPAWESSYRTLMALCVMSITLLIALVVVVLLKAPIGGLIEKAFILDRNVWILMISSLALAITAKPDQKPSALAASMGTP